MSTDYEIIKLLGHGKGGYSYLACSRGGKAVLKQIHHEPCDYYTFGNKIEAEKNDYRRLKEAGIRIPAMIAVDDAHERIVKDYIDGPTVFELVRDGVSAEPFIVQVREMAELAKRAGLNIDYFPTNFVVHDQLIYYIDYECNQYMDEWNFENWGIKYWSRTPEFEEYLKTHHEGEGIMANSFAEIKLFQVKPEKTEEFEALAERMSSEQAKWDGCISVKYVKRFYTIDGMEPGDPPRELTKVVKCVKYYSYWEFDTKENYGKAIKRFFDCYMKEVQRLLISPFDISLGYSLF